MIQRELERHSVERTYLRQSCSHGSRWIKPFFKTTRRRVAVATGAQYLYVGFSRRNKIPRCSAYDIGESYPVPASGL